MRSKTPKTFKAGGSSFTVIPYDVEYGMELLEDLLILMGEPVARLIAKLGPAMKGMEGEVTTAKLLEMDMQITDEQISSVLVPLISRLGKGQLNKLFKRILVGVQEEGQASPVADQYELRFMGDYATLFRVVALTAGAQYAGFLPGLGGLAAASATRQAK